MPAQARAPLAPPEEDMVEDWEEKSTPLTGTRESAANWQLIRRRVDPAWPLDDALANPVGGVWPGTAFQQTDSFFSC